MEVLIFCYLFAMGAAAGSYAIATLWRLRAQELRTTPVTKLDKSAQSEYNRLIKDKKLVVKSARTDHSRCLYCGHRLAWYDLIPIISWLTLRGKCRYCKKPIGSTEVLAEIGLGVLFVLSYAVLKNIVWWPSVVLWLMLLVILTILFFYDLKWQLLPTSVLWLGIALGVAMAGVNVYNQHSQGTLTSSIIYGYLMAWTILAGLYLLLSKISHEKWVGSGDAYVATIMALVLGDWRLAFVSLFLANFLGCVVVFGMAVIKKKNVRRMRVAFAPMLIASLIMVYLLQWVILQKISWLMFDV
jgi:type 4 prepilin-like proteins leader peptide-processing enzyme